MSFGIRRGPPAIMHVTHYKAGSQWILAILQACVPELVVQPEPGVAHFLGRKLERGKVYPALYVTREQFEAANLPRRWRRFVVIRDLRDTLVSAYFSARHSHPTDRYPFVVTIRDELQSRSKEEGLLYLIRQSKSAVQIQRSWLGSGVEPVKFEQLLDHSQDRELLERVLIDECELPVTRERLRSVVEGARFHRLSGGREPGEEDPQSHWRKGVAGDWRNHFTEAVKDAFKDRWGEDLIAAGYERDDRW